MTYTQSKGGYNVNGEAMTRELHVQHVDRNKCQFIALAVQCSVGMHLIQNKLKFLSIYIVFRAFFYKTKVKCKI